MKLKSVLILLMSLSLLGLTSGLQAISDAELEALENELEQQEAEEKRKSVARAKEVLRKKKEAEKRALAEAEAKRLAEEKAAKQAELDRQAEIQRQKENEMARQAEIKRQFEEKIAEQERQKKEKRILLKSLAGEFVTVPQGTIQIDGRNINVQSFQMGKHEISQEQWQRVMGTNPATNKGCSVCPVEFVSWHDVQAFIRTLNKKTENSFRLPTVAEWEYACAHGSDALLCLGQNFHAMILANRGETKLKPTSQGTTNSLGLKGMNSNAWEWTCSAYKEDYDGSENNCVNGKDLNTTRAIRGGAKIDYSSKEFEKVKLWNNSNLRYGNIGFRLVKEE